MKIFKDVHEPIIDRETFEKVQSLLGNVRHKAPKDPEKERNIFSDLMFCADCGSRMWYHVKHNKEDQYFFSCSNYKGDRGTCPETHMIRADALEIVVQNELKQLIAFYKADEQEFVKMLSDKANKEAAKEKKRIEAELAKCRKRLNEIPVCYKVLFEKSVSGEIDTKHFNLLAAQYDEEEATLKDQASELTEELQKFETEIFAEKRFLNAVRKLTEMKVITAPILYELIEKIEVFAVQGTGKNRTQRIVIHYRFVGPLNIPKEAENYTLNSRKGVAVEYLTDSKTA